jgi:hypothetical protein
MFSRYFYYPAIQTDGSENLIAVFSGSSAGEYASVYPSGQKTTELQNTFQTPVLIKAGEDAYTPFANRWGDYSGAAIDSTNQAVVWVAGEYAVLPIRVLRSTTRGAFHSLDEPFALEGLFPQVDPATFCSLPGVAAGAVPAHAWPAYAAQDASRARSGGRSVDSSALSVAAGRSLPVVEIGPPRCSPLDIPGEAKAVAVHRARGARAYRGQSCLSPTSQPFSCDEPA